MESYLSLSLADVSTGSTCKTFTSLKADTIPLGRGGRGNQDCNLLTSGLFRSDQTKCMSQKHAELSWDKGEYAFLKDVGSTNGTFVEREGAEAWKLKAGIPYRLKNNDRVTFGKVMNSPDGTVYTPISLLVTLTTSSLPPTTTTPTANLRASPDLATSTHASPALPAISSLGDFSLDPSPELCLPPSSEPERPARKGYGLSEAELLQSGSDAGSVLQVDSDEEVEAIAEETYSGGARRWSPINWTPEEWDQDERPRLSQNELPPLQIEVVEDERTQVGRGTSHFVEDVDLESDGSVIDDDSQPFALSDDDIAHFGPAQIALESNGSVIDDNVAHSSPLQIDFDDDESDPEVEKPSHFDPPQSHLEIDLDDESDLDVTEPSKPIERFRIFSPIDTSDASSEVEVESPKPVLLPLLSRSQAHSRALLSLGGIFDSPYPDKDSDDDQSDHSSQSSLPASKEPPPSSQASPARHSNAHTFADESLQTFSMRIQELKEMQKDGDEESCASHLPSPKESPPRAVERRLFVEEASEEERQQGRDDLMAILDAVADARRRGTLVESDEESEVDEDDFVDEADDVDEDDFGDLVELDDGDFDRACAGILVVKAENELDENESKQDESDVEEPSEQVCEGWKTWRMNVASESMEDVDAEMGWVPAVTFGEEPLEVERVEQAVEDSSTVVEKPVSIPLSSPHLSPRKRLFSESDLALPTPTDNLEREIAPLPKRRRLFDLSHVALGSAVGFVGGVVVAIAGLSALEGFVEAMEN